MSSYAISFASVETRLSPLSFRVNPVSPKVLRCWTEHSRDSAALQRGWQNGWVSILASGVPEKRKCCKQSIFCHWEPGYEAIPIYASSWKLCATGACVKHLQTSSDTGMQNRHTCKPEPVTLHPHKTLWAIVECRRTPWVELPLGHSTLSVDWPSVKWPPQS